MIDPLITEPEVRCALDCFNPDKGAGPSGHFPKVLKALSPYLTPELARVLNLSPRRSHVTNLLSAQKLLSDGLSKGAQLTLATWVWTKHST